MEEGVVGEEEGERVAAIRQAFQADKDKLTKIKTLLVSNGHRRGHGSGRGQVNTHTYRIHMAKNIDS